jgi:hypothetical protein|tara:strand:+ start:13930 stop:14748 length:819 start_codon:yes stop_codon:yes gene_type:complete
MLDNNFKNQIKSERRRRNQSYQALDYIISRVTYFDFFSADAFNIAKYGKYFAQILNKKTVTSEILLFPFIYCDSNLSLLLKKYGIHDKIFDHLSLKLEKQLKTKKQFGFLNRSERNLINENIPYSIEVNLLFEKAAENALTRFKTPVITSEILFVTMMEEEHTKIGKLLKQTLLTDSEWHILRYRIVKSLHSNESAIRSEVSKNQQYFAYLLKTELPEKEFNKLIEDESIVKGVEMFRNVLIKEITQINIFKLLTNEIKKSIKVTNNRKYSS